MKNLLKLDGFEISFHEKSKRIINIKIEDQIIDRARLAIDRMLEIGRK